MSSAGCWWENTSTLERLPLAESPDATVIVSTSVKLLTSVHVFVPLLMFGILFGLSAAAFSISGPAMPPAPVSGIRMPIGI